MCGRFGLTNTRGRVSRMFPGVQLPPDLEDRYNIAPTQPVLAVGRTGARLLRWGISGRNASGHFNLRTDTILKIAASSEFLTTGRVIIPASHFYEWTGQGLRRHPMAIARRDEEPLALAGLQSTWIDPHTGEAVPAVTILTTEANSTVRPFHNRMPVILESSESAEWRSGRPLTHDRLKAVLEPFRDDALDAYAVSRRVNDVRHEGPDLLQAPPPDTEEQLELLA